MGDRPELEPDDLYTLKACLAMCRDKPLPQWKARTDKALAWLEAQS